MRQIAAGQRATARRIRLLATVGLSGAVLLSACGSAISDVEDLDFPQGPFSQDWLEDVLLAEDELPLEAAFYDIETEVPAEPEDNPMAASTAWEGMVGLLAWTVLVPLGDSDDAEAVSCSETMIDDDEIYRMIFGEPESGSGPMAIAVANFDEAESPATMSIDVPASVAITVHEEARPGQAPPAQEEFAAAWEGVLEACAGDFTTDRFGGDGEAELTLQEYSPYSMWGIQATTSFDSGVDYGVRGETITGHLVHHYTGDISIRALGINMDEEDFEEILEAQLSKLEESS